MDYNRYIFTSPSLLGPSVEVGQTIFLFTLRKLWVHISVFQIRIRIGSGSWQARRVLMGWRLLLESGCFLSLKNLVWIRIGSEFSNSLDLDPKPDQQNVWIRIQWIRIRNTEIYVQGIPGTVQVLTDSWNGLVHNTFCPYLSLPATLWIKLLCSDYCMTKSCVYRTENYLRLKSQNCNMLRDQKICCQQLVKNAVKTDVLICVNTHKKIYVPE